mgnify:FL=1
MNKKVIIQIVIIVGAFAAAGFVLYNGLFKSDTTAVPSLGIISAKDNEKILPFGSALDFKNDLYNRNFQFGYMSYPNVNPSEIGILETQLIAPISTAK